MANFNIFEHNTGIDRNIEAESYSHAVFSLYQGSVYRFEGGNTWQVGYKNDTFKVDVIRNDSPEHPYSEKSSGA